MTNFIVLLFFIPILSAILLAINFILTFVNPDDAKISPFECGFNSIPGQTRTIFHIHFFIVALLFLIFDLEIILLLPIAVSLYHISLFGLTVGLIFFVILTIGFVLEIGSGAIKLNTKESNS